MIDFQMLPDVCSKFKGLNVAVVQGECSQNSFSDRDGFISFKTAAEQAALSIQPLAANPHVAAWRAAFKKFGADPTKTRSSGEALLRRVQKGEHLPFINAIVDVYNAISLKHALPIGGQDVQTLQGRVVLRFARAGEVFTPLGALSPQPVDDGEVVYADDKRILCSKWNYRDCEDAKISDKTTQFVLFVDGAPSIPASEVQFAGEELAESLNNFVKGCSARLECVKDCD